MEKFEDKITELENIVSELESGETDLDCSIKKYTKAIKLVKECDEKLKSIEKQVSKILTNDGQLEEFTIE